MRRKQWTMAGLSACLLAVVADCTPRLPTGNVVFVFGQDADSATPWRDVDEGASVRIELVQNGSRSTVAEVAVPAANVSLGHGGPSGVIAQFEATVSNGSTTFFRGRTIPYQLNGFDGISVPILLVKPGQFTRTAGGLARPHSRPLVNVVNNTYLVVVGRDASDELSAGGAPGSGAGEGGQAGASGADGTAGTSTGSAGASVDDGGLTDAGDDAGADADAGMGLGGTDGGADTGVAGQTGAGGATGDADAASDAGAAGSTSTPGAGGASSAGAAGVGGGAGDPTLSPYRPDYYDMSAWAAIANTTDGSLPADFPILPKSMASRGSEVLLIDESQAVWVNVVSGQMRDVTAPSGLDFSELAGGRTLVDASGVSYVIGATRPDGAATDKVLRIDADGSLHALALSTARLGAAAAFVAGRLIVAGGSADGAGAERLSATGDAFAELSLPADPTQGAGLAELDSSTALLVGGSLRSEPAMPTAQPTRTFDPDCTRGCDYQAVTCAAAEVDAGADASPDAAGLVRVQAFSVETRRVLAIGENLTGNHAFLLDASGDSLACSEIALPSGGRARGTALVLPNGQIALVGGVAPGTTTSVTGLDVFWP